jgi:hypothetical protein
MTIRPFIILSLVALTGACTAAPGRKTNCWATASASTAGTLNFAGQGTVSRGCAFTALPSVAPQARIQ